MASDEMTFLEHLEELRWRLIKGLAAILLFAIIAYVFIDDIMIFLARPAEMQQVPITLQAIHVSDIFMVQLISSLLVGLVAATPIVLYQAWQFVSPALAGSAKGTGLFVVLVGTFFFLGGLTFGYAVILPMSLRFFSGLGDGTVANNYSILGYFGYVSWMLLSTGLVFQLPVISFILTRVGLLTPAFLKHYRKYSTVAILVFSAVLTPPDPVSQVLMAVPLLGLYELSVLISRIFQPASSL